MPSESVVKFSISLESEFNCELDAFYLLYFIRDKLIGKLARGTFASLSFSTNWAIMFSSTSYGMFSSLIVPESKVYKFPVFNSMGIIFVLY